MPSVYSGDTVNLRAPRPDWLHPLLAMLNQKSTFNFVNLYQHAKNKSVSSICCGEIIDLKICNLIGWEHFRLYLRNKILHKYGICNETLEIKKKFTIEQIHWVLMTTFFLKAHFPNFWGKKDGRTDRPYFIEHFKQVQLQ